MKEHLFLNGKLLPAREIELRLPFILARDLDGWRADNRNDCFVVMIDEYESALEAGGAGSRFRPNEFDDTTRDLVAECRATLFVFFSREKLRWNVADRAWRALLDRRQHLLGGLSRSDPDLFLRIAHVDDGDIRKRRLKAAVFGRVG